MRNLGICLTLLLLPLAACSKAPTSPAGMETVFRQDPHSGLTTWSASGGDWSAPNGQIAVRNPSTDENALALPRRAPTLGTQTVEGIVNVQQRLAAGGWSLAGITIYSDPENYWVLSLTEDEQGKRYVDFLENLHGVWQAQSASGPTKLTEGPSSGSGAAWVPGHDYRLRLQLSGGGIQSTVSDAASSEVIAARSFTFGTADAVRTGTAGFIARGCAAQFAQLDVEAPASAVESPAGIHVEKGPLGTVAMLRDSLPGTDLQSIDSLAARLRTAGFGVTFLSADDVTRPAVLDPTRFSLYAIPNAAVYPADGADSLLSYLRRGGNLMVLGGPPFTDPVWRRNGEWLDADTLRARLAKTPTEHIFFSFTPGQSLQGWNHASNDTTIPTTAEVVPGGPKGQGALKVSMANFTGWSTFRSPSIQGAFAPGQDLLTFWAKGDAKTPQLSVEIDETDGSRWIGVVGLTTDWTYKVMNPVDFHYWPDSPTQGTRGGAGDQLNFQHAERLVIGLATSHTHQVGGGPHTFWVADFGTAANPYAGFGSKPSEAFFPIETVTPSYKVYPLHDIQSMTAAPDQTILPGDLRLPVTGPAFSCFERPMGKGFDNHPRWRWIPLVRAMDGQGRQRGIAVWMLLNETAPFQGSAFAVFGIQDQALYRNDALGAAVVDAARAIGQGAFLGEGGSREFCYWPGETVQLGARALNCSSEGKRLAVRWSVARKQDGRRVFTADADLNVDAGSDASATQSWTPNRPSGDCEVTTELLRDGRVIDRISHEIGFLSAAQPPRSAFITVQGSYFMLNGHKWNPVGVNFWPLSASGLEPGDYRTHWLARGFYDPEQVEQDLDRVQALGMNMVSIQMGGPDNMRNTLDFLRRCQRHGIHVNGFLSGASPLDFHPDAAHATIESGRLSENPTLFAYDIIWEPGNSVFNAAGRPRWDPDWRAWIVRNYGSVANAEADWGMSAPMENGQVTSPSDLQLRDDGPWRVMVAAYRRFMDDLISRKWNDATRQIRQMDPNHLISFRQGNTLPQDFAFTGPVKHIDFISPEGYSIPPGETGLNAAGFTIRYVHFTTGGKPVFWAEFGRSIWNHETGEPDPAALPGQADYIELFCKATLAAGANGLAPWWWPGGLRVDESSDFGIMNPDGTPRPAAEVVAHYAPQMEAPRDYPAPTTWLTIDRDAQPGGYWWIIFHEGQEAYARARAAGQNLGVRTAGTGTDSTNTPLTAVGNRPYNGHNPLKYLNAEFNWLQVQDRDGKWVDVADGAEIPVAAGRPVRMRASVGNLQEATWIAPANTNGRAGGVYLAAAEGSDAHFRQPIPADVPYLGDANLGEFQLSAGLTAPTHLTLRMTAADRAWFGEPRSFTLVPG